MRFALKIGVATGVLARVEKVAGRADLKHRAIEAILKEYVEGPECWEQSIVRNGDRG